VRVPSSYTHKRLDEVEDSAPRFGYGELQEARFANEELATEHTGVSFLRVKPGKRQGFAHRHEEAEEVYVVVGGSGRVKLDDEILELERLDAIRVAPRVTRQFEGGPDGIELVAFGRRHERDGEIFPGWWRD
jgi:mannose-6-phosphate isomerase-like protein (cupin superfamily)